MYQIFRIRDIRRQCNDIGGKRGKGAESLYFQITPTTGIKIIRNPVNMWCMATKEKYDYLRNTSLETLMRSPLFVVAKNMFGTLQNLAKIKRAPVPYELVVVRVGPYLYPAIIMEHIDLSARHRSDSRWRAMRNVAWAIGNRFGISDLHEDNLVFDKKAKRFKLIDVGGYKVDPYSQHELEQQARQYATDKEYKQRILSSRKKAA